MIMLDTSPESITMYHAGVTGAGDVRLQRLLDKGVLPTQEYYSVSQQRKGFFVNSDIEGQRIHAVFFHEDEAEEDRPPGRPMFITVQCKFGRGFDLDYEDEYKLALEIMAPYRDSFRNLPSGMLTLPEGHAIHRITPVPYTSNNAYDVELYTEDNGSISYQYALLRDSDFSINFARAGLLQAMRDYLVETHSDNYLQREKECILNELALSPRDGVSMKSHGVNVAEIVKIEVWDHNRWHELPLDQKKSVEPMR